MLKILFLELGSDIMLDTVPSIVDAPDLGASIPMVYFTLLPEAISPSEQVNVVDDVATHSGFYKFEIKNIANHGLFTVFLY